MINVSVKVQGLDELMSRMNRMDAITVEEHTRAMASAVTRLQKETVASMQEAASENRQVMMSESAPALAPANPAKVENILQSRVTNRSTWVQGTMKSKGSKTFYLTLIESGREAGRYPKVAPLVAWAEETLGMSEGDAKRYGRQLAKRIGGSGIRGTPVLEKSLNKTIPQILNAFDQANERIVERLAGK